MGRSVSEEFDLLRSYSPTEAIELIMDRYGEEIKRLVYTYVKNIADADDVTQEIFLTVYRKLDSFKGESSLRSWLYSIAINKSKDHLRSWKVRNEKLKDKLIQFNQPTKGRTPEEFTIEKTESNLLLETVLMLPVKYREVLILYYFKELSIREIADSLSIKQTTIRTRINRGRERLKLLLDSLERGENIG